MHAIPPEPREKKWHEKWVRSGYLLGAILFHLILFLLVATIVIWQAPTPPPTDTFLKVAISVPPPPVQPPSSGGAANNPMEPQPVVVPVVTPTISITTKTSTFDVPTPKVLKSTLDHLKDEMAKGSGLDAAGGGSGQGNGNAFGSANGTGQHLTGYFYDLKQEIDKTPTGMDISQYTDLMSKYIAEGWDDSLLTPYYKCNAPLSTNTIAISTRPSEAAPAAFGLEKEAQAGMWIVLYHAQVMAPEPGQYRLAGFADNILAVRINGNTVLDAGWTPLTSDPSLHKDLPFAFPSYAVIARGARSRPHPPDPFLRIGPVFTIEPGKPVDMDVLIGDCGGVCSFFLLIENVGKTYQKLQDGTPLLPFFQLNNGNAPSFLKAEEHPPYSTTAEPWQPAQD